MKRRYYSRCSMHRVGVKESRRRYMARDRAGYGRHSARHAHVSNPDALREGKTAKTKQKKESEEKSRKKMRFFTRT